MNVFQSESQEDATTTEAPPSSADETKPSVLPVVEENNGYEFGEDLYEPVVSSKPHTDEFEDDGFATDEFDSGSSDGEAPITNSQASPQQGRKAKKKKFFNWLKKKSKKDKLFASPQDGVTLAGYAQRLENTTCSKRWFLIREGKLHCYKAIKDEEPELSLELGGTDIKAGDEDKNKLAVKVLKDGETQVVLVAKSAKDLERWKIALKIESGFIKHASPTSSGVYEEEEEGDYVEPVSSPGLHRISAVFPSTPSSSATDENEGLHNDDEEELYMEVIPTSVAPSVSHSPSQECLGPLPAIPPELPPPRPVSGEVEKDESDNEESEYEVYEEVSSSIPHADKINQWGEKVVVKVNDGNPDSGLNDTETKEAKKLNKGEESNKTSKGKCFVDQSMFLNVQCINVRLMWIY